MSPLWSSVHTHIWTHLQTYTQMWDLFKWPPFFEILWKDYCFYFAIFLNYAVSKAVWCDSADYLKLWRPFGANTPKDVFGVRLCSLTGHGSTIHCQVQMLVSLGKTCGGHYVFSILHSLCVSALLSDFVALVCSSRCLLRKSSKWRQMPWSFSAFSILACLLWHLKCTLREQTLIFPFLLKPQAPSAVISVQHPWCSMAAVSVCLSCNFCHPLPVTLCI